MKKNKALFALSSLGLGHATRTSVVINHFLELGYSIDIITFGNALNFLKAEIKSENINFIELEDYPPLERGKGWRFYFYLVFDVIKTTFIIRKENNFVASIANNYDFIFSDCRYGVYSKDIPSFLLNHQLAFVMPKGMGFLQGFTDFLNVKYLKNFNNVFIPDFEDINNSLAGKLSHPKWINKINHKHIGILSSFYDFEAKENNKIDYLFTISGYLLENKENFINQLLKEAKELPGKKVFVLGDAKNNYKKELQNNITIYSFVSGEKRKEFFKNAGVIISRAGYTTIMDLVQLEKKAILFPTPNQTEQEYLAEFLGKNNLFAFGNEYNNLPELVEKLDKSKIFISNQKTKESLIEIEKIIFKYI